MKKIKVSIIFLFTLLSFFSLCQEEIHVLEQHRGLLIHGSEDRFATKLILADDEKTSYIESVRFVGGTGFYTHPAMLICFKNDDRKLFARQSMLKNVKQEIPYRFLFKESSELLSVAIKIFDANTPKVQWPRCPCDYLNYWSGNSACKDFELSENTIKSNSLSNDDIQNEAFTNEGPSQNTYIKILSSTIENFIESHNYEAKMLGRRKIIQPFNYTANNLLADKEFVGQYIRKDGSFIQLNSGGELVLNLPSNRDKENLKKYYWGLIHNNGHSLIMSNDRNHIDNDTKYDFNLYTIILISKNEKSFGIGYGNEGSYSTLNLYEDKKSTDKEIRCSAVLDGAYTDGLFKKKDISNFIESDKARDIANENEYTESSKKFKQNEFYGLKGLKVSVYSRPEFDSNIVGFLNSQDTVKVVNSTSNGFLLITANDISGYIFESYLGNICSNSMAKLEETALRGIKSVDLYSKGNFDSEVIISIPSGSKITLLGHKNESFILVQYNQYKGYIFSSYITK